MSPELYVTILCEEFFLSKLRGYGGFGKTTLNLCSHFNNTELPHNVCLTQRLALCDKPSVQRWHNTEVLFLWSENALRRRSLRLLSSLRPALFMTIEYYPTYNFPLLLLDKVPLIIYIRDPRGPEEWERLATVPLELKQRYVNSKEELVNLAEQKAQGMKELINSKRKIIFASNAPFLTDRAKKTYGIEFDAHPLNNPIPFPEIAKIEYTDKPVICWIGRLDAQKRFWIVFEIAKRCPHINFVMLGQSQRPDLMGSLIEKGRDVPNLKMLPVDDDQIKAQTFRNCWALLNTSIHEGYPVTFQEAFSYGKPVISSVNAGGVTEKYGYYTGEILGEGVREEDLNKFCNKIEECISDNRLRLKKGREALAYVRENHSFELYEKQLKDILKKEGISNIFNTAKCD